MGSLLIYLFILNIIYSALLVTVMFTVAGWTCSFKRFHCPHHPPFSPSAIFIYWVRLARGDGRRRGAHGVAGESGGHPRQQQPQLAGQQACCIATRKERAEDIHFLLRTVPLSSWHLHPRRSKSGPVARPQGASHVLGIYLIYLTLLTLAKDSINCSSFYLVYLD